MSRAQKNQNSINLFLNKYFPAVLFGILILFLLLVYLFLINPKLKSTRAAIQSNIETQEILRLNTQRKLDSLKTIDSLYKKISPVDLQKFNSVLPDTYAREKLFGELEEIFTKGGWLVSEITISPREKVTEDNSSSASVVSDEEGGTASKSAGQKEFKPEPLGTIDVQLSVEAIDYAGFKKMIKILENNLRLFDIKDLEFSPTGENAQVILTTYYYQSPLK